MGLKRLLTQVSRPQSQIKLLKSLYNRSYNTSQNIGSAAVYKVPSGQRRFQSSYGGGFGRRIRERDTDRGSDAAFRELYHRNDPEAIIRQFESQPYMHSNPSALKEYVKALVKVDRLDESELLKTLQRGMAGSGKAAYDEEMSGGFSALKNVGKNTKEGVLGTAAAPIHMVATEGGHLKEQIWRTVRALGMTFLLMSGVGALIEDRGITKGLGLHDEVQPSMESSTKFSDVKGVDEAKAELEEIVYYLRDPKRFTRLGGKLPKGVLLVGPPGTGKTLLAKAIAGEAGVPFFSISGSEFVEMFVGVGASRVRDLFKKAKENAPCIVFVDEIDAVGRQRGTGIGGGNDEREQTLNQLLTEMDGFEGNTGIIVVAATNRADILDSALLRPGRFDRQVSVDVPDVRGRTEILKVHAGNKKFDKDVSLEVIAMRTPGFSGADLANLLNEAAILAGRRAKTAISSKEIDDSIDRIVAGMEGTVMTDGKSKSLVAYHEVGHAICGTLTPGHDAVQKVTLVPRGQARGLTWFIPADDPTLISRQQLFARIVGGLGGRAAEEVIFGEPEVTTGAAGDLQQITGLAKQMVVTFGMSEIGPWSLMDGSGQSQDVIMRMMARNSMSEKLAEDIDTAIKKLSDSAYEIALSHIRNNREAMDKIVEVLIEKETMGGDEFRAILSEFTEIPVENRVAPVTPTPVNA